MVWEIGAKKSGIKFLPAETWKINGPRIERKRILASKYKLKMVSTRDRRSKNSQTDTSAGAAYYIHPDTGELVTVAAGEPMIHPTLGNVSLPAYEQLCQNSEDPGEWVFHGATYADTGEAFGPFTEGTITDVGTLSDRAYIYDSSDSGSPSGILYNSIRYRAGTSGSLRLMINDVTASIYTYYLGTIGSATISGQGNAGTLTIISDEYNSVLGYYILKFSFLANTLSNRLIIAVGPNSATNKTIKLLGADVSEDPAILDFHVPSSGSNVTIASRAGTTKFAGLADNFPKLYDALGGNGSTPAAARHTFTWTPGVSYTDHTTVESIMTPSDADGFLKASAAGGFELSDGTNTLRWPPTVGDDIPRSWSILTGSPTVTGDVIDFLNETGQIRIISYWEIGKSYRINCTISDYAGTGSIYLPYDSLGASIVTAINGAYEYDYSPDTGTGVYIYSFSGHTATVTVNSIYELAPYQFEAGTSYPMEIVYGFNEVLDDYKMELSVYIDGEWISVMGDFDQYFDIGDPADFIYGLSNPHQSSVKGLTTEKLQQSYWRS